MRSRSVAAAAAPLLVALAIVSSPVDAAWDKMNVREGGINFKIRYKDGSRKPYKVIFWEDGVKSTYRFKENGCVNKIFVGTEKYTIRHRANGDIRRVNLNSSRRRLNEADDDDDDEEEEMAVINEGDVLSNASRRLYDCVDCEATWDLLCDEGLACVCQLVGYGSPLSAAAEKSIETMCDKFGNACASLTAQEACEGHCVESTAPPTTSAPTTPAPSTPSPTTPLPTPAPTTPAPTPSGPNSCLDPTSDNYKCSPGDQRGRLILTSCDMLDRDLPLLASCFQDFGETAVRSLYLDKNLIRNVPEDLVSALTGIVYINLSFNRLRTVPEAFFAGLTEIVYIGLYNNKIEILPEGLFQGLTKMTKLVLSWNELNSLPVGLFSGLFTTGEYNTLYLGSNALTTVPAGVFDGLDLFSFTINDNPALQCIPPIDTDNFYSDGPGAGICGCDPVEAVTCTSGTCQPGEEGYTCA